LIVLKKWYTSRYIGIHNKSKSWNDKLNRAIETNDTKTLEALAQDVISEALKGNVVALKEIGDCLDGEVDY